VVVELLLRAKRNLQWQEENKSKALVINSFKSSILYILCLIKIHYQYLFVTTCGKVKHKKLSILHYLLKKIKPTSRK
jgi:hypothetical protein